MKIELSARHVRRRAAELYAGESLPISALTEGREVLKPEWWTTNPQTESPNSQRQMAAMRLYLEIGRAAKPQLPAGAFPAQMDCGGESFRPDKAIIKVFLEEGLLTHRLWGAQLIFDLTPSGGSYLK